MAILQETATLVRIRALLLATLAVGMLGTGTELLLLGHFESTGQFVPLVLLAAGLGVLAWHAWAPGQASVRALQITMLIFVVSGGIGIGLHFDGNVALELETRPSLDGFDLIGKTLAGNTPVFAPGTMILLGLMGLAHTYDHPKGSF